MQLERKEVGIIERCSG
jgi:hypothetical protein